MNVRGKSTGACMIRILSYSLLMNTRCSYDVKDTLSSRHVDNRHGWKE